MMQSNQLSSKIIRNSMANLVRILLPLPVSFFLTPFIIHKIGTAGFGAWALIQVILAYIQLFDLGVGNSLVKFIAELDAKQETEKINLFVSTAFVFYLCAAILVCLPVLAARGWLINTFFQSSSVSAQEIDLVLTGVLIIFLIRFPFSVFSSVLNGLQRMDWSNGISLLSWYLNAGVIVVTLQMGMGLTGLLIASSVTTLTSITLTPIAAKRILPSLRLSPLLFRRQHFRTIVNFSVQLQSMNVATMIHQHLDKLIIGHFIGLQFVGEYEIARRAIERLRDVPLLLLSPVMPAASEVGTNQQDKDLLRRLYARSQRYSIMVSVPIFAFLGFFAQPFIAAWIGPGHEPAAFALQLFAFANFINVLTAPGSAILVGVGLPRYPLYSSLLGAVLNVSLSLIMTILWGYSGAVVATTSSLIIASLYFIWLFHRVQRVSTIATLLIPNVRSVLVGSLVFSLARAVSWNFSWHLSGLFILALACVAIYVLILLVSGFFDQYERRKLASYYLQTIQFVGGK